VKNLAKCVFVLLQPMLNKQLSAVQRPLMHEIQALIPCQDFKANIPGAQNLPAALSEDAELQR